ncbi:MAG: carbohydrate ABC transporter permease [Limnochordia bacterium]|jgi:multiple sugar transport system permease protein|nr:carbohydrate ABC transporter permease [Bacillota bacterium]NLH30302.1 carbohydrate ABC transporter permease [Bacillota bacterium]
MKAALRKAPEAKSHIRLGKYLHRSYWLSLAWSLVRGILIIGLSFIILYPIIIKISSSLMTERDLFDLTTKWLPRKLDLVSLTRNYRDLWIEMQYPKAFLNSFSLALLVAVLQLISTTTVGYGFARFPYFGSNFMFAMVIFTLLVPPQMVMIPLFLNFRFFDGFGLFRLLHKIGLVGQPEISLLGTFWPFVLTSITAMGLKNGLFIYIMRQFFKGMPKELEEAALVDGAGPVRTFFTIMLPGASAVMIVVFLFSFVWQWNDIFLTRMYIRGHVTMLPFMLEKLNQLFDSYGYSDQYISVIINTGMLMFMAPLLVLYGLLQRYFVESVERTGIVG